MLCMTLGRPIMVSIVESDRVPLPREIEDLRLVSNHRSGQTNLFRSAGQDTTAIPTERTSSSILSFFVKSARLYRIVQQILSLTPMERRRVSESGTERSLEISKRRQSSITSSWLCATDCPATCGASQRESQKLNPEMNVP
jgi:hypothetical protein